MEFLAFCIDPGSKRISFESSYGPQSHIYEYYPSQKRNHSKKDLVVKNVAKTEDNKQQERQLQYTVTENDKRSNKTSPFCRLCNGDGQKRSGSHGSGKPQNKTDGEKRRDIHPF